MSNQIESAMAVGRQPGLTIIVLAVLSHQSLASLPTPSASSYPPALFPPAYPGSPGSDSRRRLSGGTLSTNPSQSHTHVIDNTAGFVYVGCYKDDADDRDLAVLKSDQQDMTPNICNTECNGYDYFAIQISRCWCGQSYGKHGTAQTQYSGLKNADNLDYEPGCHHECRGHSTGYPCGGVHRNSVYRRPSTMEADCQTGDRRERTEHLTAQNVCKPQQDQLAPAAMPPGTEWVDPAHSEAAYSHPGRYEHKDQPCPGQHNCYKSGGELPSASAQIWSDAQSHQVY